jgi:hypothetical protein
MKRITRALIVIVCAAAPYAAAQTTFADLRKQVTESEVAVMERRLAIPDCSAAPAAELVTFIQSRAAKFGVKSLKVQPIEASEKFAPSLQLNRIDITGRGAFADIDQLLDRIALQRLARVLDFETLTIAASDGGTVILNARVSIACWSEEPPTPTRVRRRARTSSRRCIARNSTRSARSWPRSRNSTPAFNRTQHSTSSPPSTPTGKSAPPR